MGCGVCFYSLFGCEKNVQTRNKMQPRRSRCKINPWMLGTITRQGEANWTADVIWSALVPRSGSKDGFWVILPCLCSSSLSRRLCISMYLQIAALVANIGIYIFVEWRKLTLNDMHLCTWTWFGGIQILRTTVLPSDFAIIPVRFTTYYTCKVTPRAKFEAVPPGRCNSRYDLSSFRLPYAFLSFTNNPTVWYLDHSVIFSFISSHDLVYGPNTCLMRTDKHKRGSENDNKRSRFSFVVILARFIKLGTIYA